MKKKLTMSISLVSMHLQNIEREIESEYLFCTYSVATNLVTSLEFSPIRRGTMLCHLGQTRNGSVATHFTLFRSIVTSSATSGYVAVPERVVQNEEPDSREEE